ncbi:MAG: hypothetical protein ACUVWJ_07240 [Spirochaetota bacterium]
MSPDIDYVVELMVNGKRIGMNRFVQALIINVIMGILSSLKNTGKPDEVVLTIGKKQ